MLHKIIDFIHLRRVSFAHPNVIVSKAGFVGFLNFVNRPWTDYITPSLEPLRIQQ